MINLRSNPNEWSTLHYELDDAKEHLESLINQLNESEAIDEEDFKVQLSHVYAHINRSWNFRNLNHDLNSEENDLLSQFPKDIVPL